MVDNIRKLPDSSVKINDGFTVNPDGTIEAEGNINLVDADITRYVDPDAGDDSNDGLTWGTAWKTLDFASRWIEKRVNLQKSITINCKSGTTYTEEHDEHIHWKLPAVGNSSGLVKFLFDTRPSIGTAIAHGMARQANGLVYSETQCLGRGQYCALSTPGANQIKIAYTGSYVVAPNLTLEFGVDDIVFVGILKDDFEGYGVVQSVTADTITFKSGSWMGRDWNSIGDPSLANIGVPGSMICFMPDTIYNCPSINCTFMAQGENIHNLQIRGIHFKGDSGTRYGVYATIPSNKMEPITYTTFDYPWYDYFLIGVTLTTTADASFAYGVVLKGGNASLAYSFTNMKTGWEIEKTDALACSAYSSRCLTLKVSKTYDFVGISRDDYAVNINRESGSLLSKGLIATKYNYGMDIDGCSGAYLSDLRVYALGNHYAVWIYRGSTVFIDESSWASIYESAGGAQVLLIDQSNVYIDPITINVPDSKKGIFARRMAQVLMIGGTIQPVAGALNTIGVDAETGARVDVTPVTITCATDVVAVVKDQYGQEQGFVHRTAALDTINVPDPLLPLNVANKQWVEAQLAAAVSCLCSEMTKQTTDGSGQDMVLTVGTYPIVIPDGESRKFKIELIARQTGGTAGTVGDTKAFRIDGAIKNVSTNVSIVGGMDTKAHFDAGASAWTKVVTADNVAKALKITVTGELNKTIEWVAKIYWVKAS